jgi:hydroxymethylpyrimidine pyrophosphatase-like HAD family hydrolase
MNIAFDVDDTLVLWKEKGKYDLNVRVIFLLDEYFRDGNKIYIWSGGGPDYAKHICRLIGIDYMVDGYIVKEKRHDIDVCYDDQKVKLAKTNVCVTNL